AEQLVPAAALLAGVAVVGYTRHPRAFALTRLRAVAEAVAEREIAQERERQAKKGGVSHSQTTRERETPAALTATSAATKPADRAAAATDSAWRSCEA